MTSRFRLLLPSQHKCFYSTSFNFTKSTCMAENSFIAASCCLVKFERNESWRWLFLCSVTSYFSLILPSQHNYFCSASFNWTKSACKAVIFSWLPYDALWNFQRTSSILKMPSSELWHLVSDSYSPHNTSVFFFIARHSAVHNLLATCSIVNLFTAADIRLWYVMFYRDSNYDTSWVCTWEWRKFVSVTDWEIDD